MAPPTFNQVYYALSNSSSFFFSRVRAQSGAQRHLPSWPAHILKSKKEELELTKRWQSSHAEVVDNTDESYSPAAEKRAYEAFSDLVNLFNKRANNKAVVSKEDVDSNFINIIDYIRLNKDNKAYVDAVNLLSDPYNMKLITNSMISAHKMVNEIFKKEHKEVEINAISNILLSMQIEV